MRDKRPKSMIGAEEEFVQENLVLLQSSCNLSNSEMANLLGVTPKYYERIKKTGKALDYSRLVNLYYNLGVDLNRLIANDTSHDILQKDVNKGESDYKVLIDNLITNIKNSQNPEERTKKILDTYDRFGSYLKTLLLKPSIDDIEEL